MKQLILCFTLILCLQLQAQRISNPRIPGNANTVVQQPEAPCSVTVSAPFDTGLFVFIISVTITGPCSEIRQNGEALAWQLLWQLMDFYKAYN